jgi:hypothetical protein
MGILPLDKAYLLTTDVETIEELPQRDEERPIVMSEVMTSRIPCGEGLDQKMDQT